MAIEARGAKCCYVASIAVVRCKRSFDGDCIVNNIEGHHTLLFDVADSDDEAYGRAMKAALAIYPRSAGWNAHSATVRSLSTIDWIRRFDIDNVEPKT